MMKVRIQSSTQLTINDLFSVEKVREVPFNWNEKFGGYEDVPPNLKEISLEEFNQLFAEVFNYVEHRQVVIDKYKVNIVMFHQSNSSGFAVSSMAQFGIKFYSFDGGR